MLVLLDLSAAFNAVDHRILLERLEQWVGVSGLALQWFSSYLSERSFSVSISSFASSFESLYCGVPRIGSWSYFICFISVNVSSLLCPVECCVQDK